MAHHILDALFAFIGAASAFIGVFDAFRPHDSG